MRKLIKRMKIRGRLFSGYAVVIIIMAIISVISILELRNSNSSMEYMINGVFSANDAVKMCRIETNIAARNLREMALQNNVDTYAAYEDKIVTSITDLKNNLEIIKSANVVSDDLYANYNTLLNEWIVIANNALDAFNSNQHDEGVRIILEECTPTLSEAILLAKEMDVEITNAMNQMLEGNMEKTDILGIVILAFLLLGIVIALVLGTQIIKGIAEPMKEIELVAKEMSEGNLQKKPSYQSKDEIGLVANSLSNSIDTLNSYIVDIKRAMGEFSKGNFAVQPGVVFKGDFQELEGSITKFIMKMSETMIGIQKAAEQVASGSEQMAMSSQELANGASEQVSAIEELSTSIDEIADQININAQNAENINAGVMSVGKEIEQSNYKMGEMIEAMNKINESSLQIRAIIETINDIASQTNLLALNASIEAARAGEAGRGFSVVADQVGLLATQSAEAAKNSTSLIQASVSAVETGTVIAEETAKGLNSVVEGAQSITNQVEEITKTSKAQAESINHINSKISLINGVVQSNSATSEECAAISEEMTSQADILKGMIEQFKIVR